MSYSQRMLDEIEAGQLNAAKKSFAWALRKDDDDTLFSLGEELYGLGFNNQAQRVYLKLLEKYPDEDVLRTVLAEIAIDNDHNDEALSYLNQIKPDSDSYLSALLVAADLYQTEEQFEVTEAKLKIAYQIAPEEPAVLFALGEFYRLVGKAEQAIPYYFALIQQGLLEFAKVDIAGRLGMAYAQAGKFDQALGYLEQVDRQYRSSDIRAQIGLIQLHTGDLKSAAATLSELIKDDPQYTSAYPALAQVYAKQDNFEQALKTLQEGMGYDEYNESLYAQAADYASHLGDSQLMDEYLAKAHQLDPENQTITLQYSNFLLDQGRHQDNLNLLSSLDEDDGIDPQAQWNAAQSYMALEQFDEAGQAFENARPSFETNPTFVKQLVAFYQLMGYREQMLDELQRYVAMVPTDEEMALRLAQAETDWDY